MGKIEDKYNELLAAGWVPAVPLPVTPLPVPGTAGYFFAFLLQNGVEVVIYDHPDVGTFEVHGAILGRYLQLGGPPAYGFPITDEIDDIVDEQVVGRVSHFEHGSVFYSNGQVSEMTVLPASGTDFEIIDGIDVSHWQGDIDWTKVAAQAIGFAYMKATEGDTATDSRFVQNWSNSNGLLQRGAYHYFQARSNPQDAQVQAQHFIDTLAMGGSAAELPPMVDVESLPAGITASQAVASLDVFLGMVWQATGQRPLIYTFPSFWKDTMQASNAFDSTYKLWIASYGRPLGGGAYATRPNGPLVPPGWSDYYVWQHAIQGGMLGVASVVDRNMVMVPDGLSLAGYLG